MMTFVIPGTPRSKKNSQRVVLRGKHPVILPSKAWCEWVEATRSLLHDVRWAGQHCNVNAQFYMDTRRTIDACNLYNGLADLLQAHGVVDDDKLFVSWDGSRICYDKDCPRVTVILTEASAPW